MDYQRFSTQLPSLYENWELETVKPKSSEFAAVLKQVNGMTTASILQILNFAVECLESGEAYCEVGCLQGASLVGALLNHSEQMAYAVDNFSEFDPFGTNLEQLTQNVTQFGIDEQVLFCYQSFEEFFHELATIEDKNPIGLYFYDAAHDYRSQLMALLLVRPFLADRALLVLSNANLDAVQQAASDFLSTNPQTGQLLNLSTNRFGHPAFWNGLQILYWDRSKVEPLTPRTFLQTRQEPFLQAMEILGVQERKQMIHRLKAEAVAAIAQYNSSLLKGYEQQPEIVNWVRKPLIKAEELYREVLKWSSVDLNAQYSLGTLYAEMGQYDKALSAFSQALELDASQPLLHNELGLIFEKIQNIPQAIQAYRQAIELDPSFVAAYDNLGNLLIQIENLTEAEALFRQEIETNPTHFGGYLGLGNVLIQQKQFEAAIGAYQKALSLQQTNPNVLQSLGTAFEAIDKPQQAARYLAKAAVLRRDFQQAIEQYERYLELQSELKAFSIDEYINLAQSYKSLSQRQKAAEIYQKAIQQYPTLEELHLQRIGTLQATGETHAAIQAAREAATVFSNDSSWQFEQWRVFPILYATTAEIDAYRDRFTQGLTALTQQVSLNSHEACQQALSGIKRRTNFLLQYQCRNDRELQTQYGEYVHRVMAANYPYWAQPLAMPPLKEGSKIRVGFVSSFFCEHVIARMNIGWLQQFNRQHFEIYSYHVGESIDSMTQQFRFLSDRFFHIPNNLEAICQQIRADNLHILVFTDIGMEPLITQLAGLRLAPVQCCGWGHPVTPGIPTIDYYLSSEQMEPDNAQEHYTETLIPLPNTGLCYPQPDIPPLAQTRHDFGLREDAIVYLSSQSLFKYLPQYDHVFAEIARQVPKAQFAFLAFPNSPQVTAQFQRRLQQAFRKVGLNSEEYCTIVSRQNQLGFWGLNKISNVLLDTLGWSGGNTVFDAISCGLPVVTCPGKFMRGRHAYGILRTMGITETIAVDEADYVAIAVKLGLNPKYRAAVQQKQQEKSSSIYNDTTCVRALENFFHQLVHRTD